jgi:RNA polymerase sigma-70 factor (ECF subfamily)
VTLIWGFVRIDWATGSGPDDFCSVNQNGLSTVPYFLPQHLSTKTKTTAMSAISLTNPATRPVLTAVGADPDYLLVQQALAGSQLAYNALVSRYRRMVFSLAADLLRNPDDANEAAQDAFLKAFRYLQSWRGECRFSTWLYRVTRTVIFDYLRRNRSRERRFPTVSTEHLTHHSDNTPTASDRLIRQEQQSEIAAALDLLLPGDRAVLTLFYLQEQSLEEICQIMNWQMSNAKSRLCRARQRLRAVLEDTALHSVNNLQVADY